jgi:RNA polymerase primary sigma factor
MENFLDAPLLSEKKVTVIRMLFGIRDVEPMALEQAGDLLGAPRERIRQIEAKALRKLRTSPRVQHLRSYLES